MRLIWASADSCVACQPTAAPEIRKRNPNASAKNGERLISMSAQLTMMLFAVPMKAPSTSDRITSDQSRNRGFRPRSSGIAVRTVESTQQAGWHVAVFSRICDEKP